MYWISKDYDNKYRRYLVLKHIRWSHERPCWRYVGSTFPKPILGPLKLESIQYLNFRFGIQTFKIVFHISYQKILRTPSKIANFLIWKPISASKNNQIHLEIILDWEYWLGEHFLLTPFEYSKVGSTLFSKHKFDNRYENKSKPIFGQSCTKVWMPNLEFKFWTESN